jgi:general transcriptional corepressor CYC8
MGDLDHAMASYEHALRHNPGSISALTQVAGIARVRENYPKVSILVPFLR